MVLQGWQLVRKANRSKSLIVALISVSTVILVATTSQRRATAESFTDFHERKLTVDPNAPIDLGVDASKFSEEQRASIPKTGEVNDLYGPQPVILGMDQCAAFRENYSPVDRYLAVAGLYNSGTNFLFDTLSKNCVLPGRPERFKRFGSSGELARGILSGVPWGKHSPLFKRPSHILPKYEDFAEFVQFNAMPVVIVKDPVFWMGSMCRRWYDVVSIPDDTDAFNRCPFLTFDDQGSPIPIKGRLAPWQEEFEYKSLVDLWNSFYQAYESFHAPRLVVRYEDLIFHGDQIVRDICSCAGGTVINYSPEERSTKARLHDQNAAHDLVQSAIFYGSKEERNSVFQTERDRVFALNNLNNSLMDKLGYKMPEETGVSHEVWQPKIPHVIWFTMKQDVLTDMYFQNVVATIDAYKALWGEPEAEVNFLTEEDCGKLIGKLSNEILPHRPSLLTFFELDNDAERKAGLCKTAALYQHGGYHFETDVKVIQAFHVRDDAEFVSPISCSQDGCLLSTSFTASVREHKLLRVALEEYSFSYEVADILDTTVLVQKKMAETYQKDTSTEERSRSFQLLEEFSTDTASFAETYPDLDRQYGHGDCNVVIRNPKKPDAALFFSHFLGSEKCSIGRIPRNIWFSHENKRIFEAKEPTENFEVLEKLVDEYRSLWNDSEASALSLTDDMCLPIVQQADENLLHYFLNTEDNDFKDDICRISAMKVKGGLFFGSPVQRSDERFVHGESAEFVVINEDNGGSFSNTDFAAVAPEHPVVIRAIKMLLIELNEFLPSESLSSLSVASILAKSFHSIDPRYRGEVILLTKEFDHFKVLR